MGKKIKCCCPRNVRAVLQKSEGEKTKRNQKFLSAIIAPKISIIIECYSERFQQILLTVEIQEKKFPTIAILSHSSANMAGSNTFLKLVKLNFLYEPILLCSNL